MDRAAFGNGLLQGAQLGWGIVRQKRMDEENTRRWNEDLEYRRSRDDQADARYQDQLEYQRSRDTIADERYQEDFGLRKRLNSSQLRNLDQQHDANQYQFDRRKQEDARGDQLREVQGWISLLQNGDDGGEVAAALNANPQYQSWLKGRGLSDAQFDRLRLNDTGKGEQGVITILKGKDAKTGEVRRGVATQNASSDPDDPVEVMPMPVLAEMVQQKANQLEDEGDSEAAEEMRTALLKRLQSYQVSLGGASKPKWGDIEYREGVGHGQRDPEGQFHQLKPEEGMGPGRFGLGRRTSGGSKNSAFTNQIYKQASAEFEDDEMNQVDNSLLRSMTVSLAQDIDLQTGGALAPGVYIQAAKEVSQGLSMSPAAAQQRAIEELSQGKLWGSYDAEDEEVQQRAAAILERDKAQFADRFVSAVGSMVDMRYGGQMSGQDQVSPEQLQQTRPADISLDDAASQMIERAKAAGKDLTPEQAKGYLMKQYPDRFGGSPQPQQAQPKRFGMSLSQQAEGFSKDVVEPVRQGLRSLTSRMNEGAKAEKIRASFYAATKSGSMPPPATLAEWLPYLSPEEQGAAVEYLQEYHPDDPATRSLASEYNIAAK